MDQVFIDFLNQIEPRSKQKENMRIAIDNLSHYLYNVSSLEIESITPFGSYSKETNIRPLNDVDLLVEFNGDKYFKWWRFWNYFIPPKAQSMYNKLKHHLIKNPNYSRTEIFQDKPTIVVDLSTIKIELVPCFQYNGNILIPNPNKKWYNDEWISTPVIEFESKLKEANELNNGKLIPLIKFLKVWKRNFNLDDSIMMSLGIEETTRDVFDKDNIIQDYPSALVDCFGYIRNKSRNQKMTIGGFIGLLLKRGVGLIWGIALGYLLDYFNRPEIWEIVDHAYDLSKNARELLNEGKTEEVHQMYKELFGREFPNL